MVKRVAVVTGSNKGIGFQVVKSLCSKFDGDVILCSRDETRGQEAVSKLNADGLKPLFFKLDVCNGEDVQRLKDKLLAEYGGVDLFINNAAIACMPRKDKSAEENMQDQVNTIQTNYFAVANLCDAIFPIVKANGRVINVTSELGMLKLLKNEEIAGVLTKPDLTRDQLDQIANQYIDDLKKGCDEKNGWPFQGFAYSSTKILLSALTWIQQREMSPKNISVFAVHPGYVQTDMSGNTGPLTPEEGASSTIFAALEAKSVDDYKRKIIFPGNEGAEWNSYHFPGGSNIDQLTELVTGMMAAVSAQS